MTPWTVARQAPLSMGFSRQKYWCGLPFPSPGDLPYPRIEPMSPTLAGRLCVFFVCLFVFFFNHRATREAQLKGISLISFSYLQSSSGISYSVIYFVPLLWVYQKCVTAFGAKGSLQEGTRGTLPSAFLPNRKPWIIFIKGTPFLL